MSEFSLINCKYIFRIDDMSTLEQKLYMEYLILTGCRIADFRQIFTPEDLTYVPYLDENIAVDKLRIREWKWLNHTLIDINVWPSDDEEGFIVLNNKFFILNIDSELELWPDSMDEYNFNIKLFQEIRINLPLCEELRYCNVELSAEHNLFFQNGIANKIESEAYEKYEIESAIVDYRHGELKEKYLNEFQVCMPVLPDVNYEFIARKIGYRLTGGLDGKHDPCLQIKFIMWDKNMYLLQFSNMISAIHIYLIIILK